MNQILFSCVCVTITILIHNFASGQRIEQKTVSTEYFTASKAFCHYPVANCPQNIKPPSSHCGMFRYLLVRRSPLSLVVLLISKSD